MQKNKLNWKIGGEAGYGIMTAGALFSKICSLSGLYFYTTAEYPSLIRGGHNAVQVRTDTIPLTSEIKEIDILVALNQETIDRNKDFIVKGGIIIYDEGLNVNINNIKKIPVPLTKIAKETLGNPSFKNTPAIAATLGVLKIDFSILQSLLESIFKKKGKEIVTKNIQAAKQGYELGKKCLCGYEIVKQKTKNNIMVDGNTAIAIGAIKAGCKFMSSYPMTPATSIMQYFVSKEYEYNLVMKQTEDEISAINMAIGAGYAGVRSMAATSGGGFSLMVEGLGFAGSAEVPVVIINCQRPGPSTGLPTRTGQGDLKFMLSASQDDFPKILIAPGDQEECYLETINAFNLAEMYQTPVMIISDKHLATAYSTIKPFNTNTIINRGKIQKTANSSYKRYAFTADGISPRVLPGTKGTTYTSAGDEHDEEGKIAEGSIIRTKMMDKRMKKLKKLKYKNMVKLHGDVNAKTTLVGWGSSKGAILEALELLKQNKVNANFLQIIYMEPFPAKQVKEILSKAKKIFLIEGNYSAQLGSLIKEHTCIDIKNKYLKYDGRPFYPKDIVREVLK
ncbi:MAG: 2-oxoacid:acceptor oxidoreductase subunit alpha [archaeon]